MNNEVIEIFKKGGIVIFPTDTAYGIGCRMDNEESVKRVYELRNRPHEKAMIALVGSVEMAEKYVEIPAQVKEKLLDKYWPGGLTVIFNCKIDKVPSTVRSDGPSLAVRFADQKEIVEIINIIGVPIIAPSANYSGEMTPASLAEVDPTLLKKVDFVLKGMCTIKGVSTIVDTTVTPWKIVREGVVKIKNY